MLFTHLTIWWQYTLAAIPHFWDDTLFITVVSQLCSSQMHQMHWPNLDIESSMLKDECLLLKPTKGNSLEEKS